MIEIRIDDCIDKVLQFILLKESLLKSPLVTHSARSLTAYIILMYSRKTEECRSAHRSLLVDLKEIGTGGHSAISLQFLKIGEIYFHIFLFVDSLRFGS